jgi:hypothetical protein
MFKKQRQIPEKVLNMKLKGKRLWGTPRSRWKSQLWKVHMEELRRRSFGKAEMDGEAW